MMQGAAFDPCTGRERLPPFKRLGKAGERMRDIGTKLFSDNID